MNKEKYIQEIEKFNYDLSFLHSKSLMISGATGMIASYLIDCVMRSNIDCKIIALGRSIEKAKKRFGDYFANNNFVFMECDINKSIPEIGCVDYIIHAASSTHPLAYSTDPIGTISTNIIGLNNLLEYASKNKTKRFIYLSSVEIYGENRGDVDEFDENYCGYLNSNTLRAGYPESKRVGEALCQAYIKQNNLDIVIPRLARIYGPTLQESDTKALSQFLYKAKSHSDIVLKSDGKQFYSYLYVKDAVTGILTCLLKGINGEVYNIADKNSDITLKELANMVSNIANVNVIHELPSDIERAGYSTATRAILNNSKIQQLGWKAEFDIKTGIEKTLELM